MPVVIAALWCREIGLDLECVDLVVDDASPAPDLTPVLVDALGPDMKAALAPLVVARWDSYALELDDSGLRTSWGEVVALDTVQAVLQCDELRIEEGGRNGSGVQRNCLDLPPLDHCVISARLLTADWTRFLDKPVLYSPSGQGATFDQFLPLTDTGVYIRTCQSPAGPGSSSSRVLEAIERSLVRALQDVIGA